ncbi:MAG: peptide chain release factor N(5)-glutamine methyltransferase [Sphingobacteriales bacterium]|nr:peptide chain release factor N(5)-glutamine methyltransferase [Sphingobacteriales bacterium]
MTVQEATYYLLNKLRSIYNDAEASNITDWVMEYITGSAKTERMLYKNELLTPKEETLVKEFTDRLLQHEPVQYVLNEAWFCGLKFYVDKNVLIPRPETEELAEWVVSEFRSLKPEAGEPYSTISFLDIGTGSGCIAISLKKKLPEAKVWACDVSDVALKVARRNAETMGADINFVQLDFPDKKSWKQFPVFDIIVSNPPYIPEKDKAQMQPNVLNYEPRTALFVPDNDPLFFYKAIAEFGKEHLRKDGNIYCEMHESLGSSVKEIFSSEGYSTELKKDMQQKDRMIRSGLV